MNKVQYLTYTGMAVIIAGITIASMQYLELNVAKSIGALSFVIGGMFSYLFSQANTDNKVPSNNQLVQALTFLFGGIWIGFANSPDTYLDYVTFLMLFIAIFELTFALTILNTDLKIPRNVYFERAFTGAIGIVAAAVILLSMAIEFNSRILTVGIVTILFGVGIMRFAVRIRTAYTKP